MNALELFVRYAHSCAEVQKEILHKIDDEQLLRVERMCHGDIAVDETFLRQAFPVAAAWLDYLAEGPWDENLIDGYFLFYHNRRIRESEGNYAKVPTVSRLFCLARVAQIVDVLEHDGVHLYRCVGADIDGHDAVNAVGSLIKDATVGDYLITHRGLAIKQITTDYLSMLTKKYSSTPGYEAARDAVARGKP